MHVTLFNTDIAAQVLDACAKFLIPITVITIPPGPPLRVIYAMGGDGTHGPSRWYARNILRRCSPATRVSPSCLQVRCLLLWLAQPPLQKMARIPPCLLQVPPIQVHCGWGMAARRDAALHAGPAGQCEQLAVRAEAGGKVGTCSCAYMHACVHIHIHIHMHIRVKWHRSMHAPLA
jgi:hypothetical protein